MTDELDPFFLYVMDLAEYDFHSLKREQSINVDFLKFPAKLMDLFKLCIQSNSEHGHGGSSTFCTNLDTVSGLFSVVESNEFKNLTHISLQLRPANDSAIKSYLASRLNMALSDSKDLRASLQETSANLDKSTSKIEDLEEELSALRSRLDNEVVRLEASHSREISNIKIQASELVNVTKNEAEQTLSNARKQSEKIISELRESLTSLQENHSCEST